MSTWIRDKVEPPKPKVEPPSKVKVIKVKSGWDNVDEGWLIQIASQPTNPSEIRETNGYCNKP